MTVSFDDISVFLSVAAAGSFAEAARRSALPTSTVSRRVAALEADLNTALLRRTSRRVSLTDEGKELVETCAGPLEEIAAATRALEGGGGEPRGRLRVTAPVQAGRDTVGPILVRFAQRHPSIRLEFHLTNSMLDLLEEGIDLAFRLGPLPDSSDIARRLWSVPYVLCAAPELLEREIGADLPIDLPELEHLPCIVTQPVEPWAFYDSKDNRQTVMPKSAIRLGDLTLGLHAAIEGLGIALLPVDMVSSALENGHLIEIKIAGWRCELREMFAVYPATRILSPKVRALIDFTVEKDQTRLEGDRQASHSHLPDHSDHYDCPSLAAD